MSRDLKFVLFARSLGAFTARFSGWEKLDASLEGKGEEEAR